MPSEPISSRQNRHVKELLRLRERRYRVAEQLTLVDGAREIMRAIEGGAELVELVLCRELCCSATAADISTMIPDAATLTYVTSQVFEKIAYGNRADGVVAVAKIPQRTFADLQLSQQAVIGVVEGLEKPGNIGAVLRSADGAGIDAVLAVDSVTDLYNPNTIRASLGTIFQLPVIETSAAAALEWLREHEFTIFAARPDARQLYHEVDARGRSAFVLGSEADGLSAVWNRPDIVPIKLPMLGVADSLNVSVTAAVLFYEAARQRNKE